MKRLLIVTPSFLPNTAADMHRARLLAPFAEALGWHVHILCVDPADNPAPTDPEMLASFPTLVEISRVRAPIAAWQRYLGTTGLYRRCVPALMQGGRSLLRQRQFDLVYFTSTAFSSFTLGPKWKLEFGVPYIVDYQDPWINPYYQLRKRSPPGGKLKHRLVQWLAARQEPKVVKMAAGLTSVTARYVSDLQSRYGSLPPYLILPFAADSPELPEAPAQEIRYWTSVGRGGEDLQESAMALAHAMQALAKDAPNILSGMQLRFIGTSYAPAGTGTPTLAQFFAGIPKVEVVEQTDRVALGTARTFQAESERLVALLSDDIGYQPSKLAGLMQSGKPLLIVAPPDHAVHQDLVDIPGVVCLPARRGCTFSESDLRELQRPTRPKWPKHVLDRFDLRLHAERLFGFFEACLVAEQIKRKD